MKKIAFSLIACLSIASSAFAGHQMASGKDYKGGPTSPCFGDHELQLDVFGLYGWSTEGSHDDGVGGGVGVNYFFTQNLGVGIDGTVRDGGSALWTASASLIARFPMDLGGTCIAPYILGGGGVQTNGTTHGSFHAGGGLEFRVAPAFSIFTEGRYIWAGNDDQVQARLGFRVVF